LDSDQGELAKHCWNSVKGIVFAAKEYDLAKKYHANPRDEFVSAKGFYDRSVALYDRQYYGEPFKTNNEDTFVRKSIQLIELSTALGDPLTAREIQTQALTLVDDRRLREVSL
jgi:hypothetical protein